MILWGYFARSGSGIGKILTAGVQTETDSAYKESAEGEIAIYEVDWSEDVTRVPKIYLNRTDAKKLRDALNSYLEKV